MIRKAFDSELFSAIASGLLGFLSLVFIFYIGWLGLAGIIFWLTSGAINVFGGALEIATCWSTLGFYCPPDIR